MNALCKKIFLTIVSTVSLTMALTGGPAMPEYTQFGQFSATDLVNLNTGNFQYTIPVLNVPGKGGSYPLALTYHSGISHHQEASWVGLGWSLNAGAINRSVVEYPDDTYQGTIFSQTFADLGGGDAGSIGVSYSFADVLKTGQGVGSFGGVIKFDTNQGFGASIGMGFNIFKEWTEGNRPLRTKKGNFGFDIGVDPGGKFNASASISGGFGLTGSVGTDGISISTGMYGFGASAGFGTGGFNGAISGPVGASTGGIAQDDITTSFSNFHLSVPIGKTGFSVSLSWTKYYSYLKKLATEQAYGYLYQGGDVAFEVEEPNSEVRSFTDYGNTLERHNSFDSLLYSSADFYMCNANGLSGTFSPTSQITSKYLDNLNGKAHWDVNGYNVNNHDFYALTNDGLNWDNRNFVETSDIIFQFQNDPSTYLVSNLFDSELNEEKQRGKKVNPIIDPSTRKLTGFEIINTNGVIYEFKKPLYNYFEISYSSSKADLIDYDAYSQQVALNKYAYTWLLTAIKSPDYIDIDENGFSDNDYGFWTKFDYTEPYQYIWRAPFENGTYNKEGNNYTVSTGVKDIAYLEKVETATHRAEFLLSPRKDGKGKAKSSITDLIDYTWNTINDVDKSLNHESPEYIDFTFDNNGNDAEASSWLYQIADKQKNEDGTWPNDNPVNILDILLSKSDFYSIIEKIKEKNLFTYGIGSFMSSDIEITELDDYADKNRLQKIWNLTVKVPENVGKLVKENKINFVFTIAAYRAQVGVANNGWYSIPKICKHSNHTAGNNKYTFSHNAGGYDYFNLQHEYWYDENDNDGDEYQNRIPWSVTLVLNNSFINSLDVKTTLSKLDSIKLYKKGFSKPLYTKSFEYDYSLAIETPNSDSISIEKYVNVNGNLEKETVTVPGGKLTLKKFLTSVPYEDTAIFQPPYVFGYDAKWSNPPFRDPGYYDNWGAHNPDGLKSHVIPQAYGPKFGASWNLADIWTPEGTHLNIIYERDEYYGISGSRPTIFETDFSQNSYTVVDYNTSSDELAIGLNYLPEFTFSRVDTVTISGQDNINGPFSIELEVDVTSDIFSYNVHKITSIVDGEIVDNIDWKNERPDFDSLLYQLLNERLKEKLSEKEYSDLIPSNSYLITDVPYLQDDETYVDNNDEGAVPVTINNWRIGGLSFTPKSAVVFNEYFNFLGGDVRVKYLITRNMLGSVNTLRYSYNEYDPNGIMSKKSSGRTFSFPSDISLGDSLKFGDFIEKYPIRFTGDYYAPAPIVTYNTVTVDIVNSGDYEEVNRIPLGGRTIYEFYSCDDSVTINEISKELYSVDTVTDHCHIDDPVSGGETHSHSHKHKSGKIHTHEHNHAKILKDEKSVVIENYTSLIGLPKKVSYVSNTGVVIKSDSTNYVASISKPLIDNLEGGEPIEKPLGLHAHGNVFDVTTKITSGDNVGKTYNRLGEIVHYNNSMLLSNTIHKSDNIKSVVENKIFDPLTAMPTNIMSQKANKASSYQVTVPAYRVYDDMRQKNMLTQSYQEFGYLDENRDGTIGDNECVSASISEWKKVFNGSSIDQTIRVLYKSWEWDPLSENLSFTKGGDANTNSNWVNISTASKFNSRGTPIEEFDLDGIYSTILLDKQETPVAVAGNAQQNEIYYRSFEDNEYTKNWDLAGAELVSSKAYSGDKSVYCKLNENDYGPTLDIPFSELRSDEAYLFSAAVLSEGETPAKVCVEIHSSGLADADTILTKTVSKEDKWQVVHIVTKRLEDYNPGANAYLRIWAGAPESNASAYIDEVRFLPEEATLRTFSYNPQNENVITICDNNSYRTSFNYDEFNRLTSMLNYDNDTLSKTEYHMLRDSVSLVQLISPANYTELYPEYDDVNQPIELKWSGPKVADGFKYTLHIKHRDSKYRSDVYKKVVHDTVYNYVPSETNQGKIFRWYVVASNDNGIEIKSPEFESMLLPPDFYEILDLEQRQIKKFTKELYGEIRATLSPTYQKKLDATYEQQGDYMVFKYIGWPYFVDRMSNRVSFNYTVGHHRHDSKTATEGDDAGYHNKYYAAEKLLFQKNANSAAMDSDLSAVVAFNRGFGATVGGNWGANIYRRHRVLWWHVYDNIWGYKLDLKKKTNTDYDDNFHVWYRGYFRNPKRWSKWYKNGENCGDTDQLKSITVRAFIYETTAPEDM